MNNLWQRALGYFQLSEGEREHEDSFDDRGLDINGIEQRHIEGSDDVTGVRVCADKSTIKDGLGYEHHCAAVVDILMAKNLDTPFTIGILGEWGAGKTSLMEMIENRLRKASSPPQSYVTAWFNPWRFEKEEHLLIPFFKSVEAALLRFQEELKNQESPSKKAVSFAKQWAGVLADVALALPYGFKGKLNLPLVEIEYDPKKHLDAAEEFSELRVEKKREYSSIYYDLFTYFDGIHKQLDSENDDAEEVRVFIFIDDLDRCAPEKIVEVLESIKLFMSIPGFTCILGVDKRAIEQGIEIKYRSRESGRDIPRDPQSKSRDIKAITAEDYLEKLVQLPIYLPPVDQDKRREFLLGLCWGDKDVENCVNIIRDGIRDNPRADKRFFNTLAFYIKLANRLGFLKSLDEEEPDRHAANATNEIPVELLVKWVIISFAFRDLLVDIKGRPERLYELQKQFLAREQIVPGEQDKSPKSVESIVEKWLGDEKLAKVLSQGESRFSNDPLDMKRYIHLSEAVVSATSGDEKSDEAKAREKIVVGKARSRIGELVSISAGPFYDGEPVARKELDTFELGVYPVTNGEFKQFVSSGGYRKKDYWTNAGWEWKEDSDVRQPSEWSKNQSQEDHPVVGVSWHEAKAYARWVGVRSRDESFRLPSAFEWRKGARGGLFLPRRVAGKSQENPTPHQQYPWGDEFDKNKSNTRESGIGGTTNVYEYLDGFSPYGCYDMAGNAWEWCEDTLEKNPREKIIHGGCFFGLSGFAKISSEGSESPQARSEGIGFRLARDVRLIRILRATYGTDKEVRDITDQLSERISDGKLSVTASNEIAGDPHHGVRKLLKIEYTTNTGITVAQYAEDELVRLP